MTVHVSATALLIIAVALVAGLMVFRWSQNRTPTGVPRVRGDLVQAVMASAAVGTLLTALLFPGGTPSHPPDAGQHETRPASAP